MIQVDLCPLGRKPSLPPEHILKEAGPKVSVPSDPCPPCTAPVSHELVNAGGHRDLFGKGDSAAGATAVPQQKRYRPGDTAHFRCEEALGAQERCGPVCSAALLPSCATMLGVEAAGGAGEGETKEGTFPGQFGP